MPKYFPHYATPKVFPWRASTDIVSIPFETEDAARAVCLRWQALGYPCWTTYQGDYRPGMQIIPPHETFSPKPKEA